MLFSYRRLVSLPRADFRFLVNLVLVRSLLQQVCVCSSSRQTVRVEEVLANGNRAAVCIVTVGATGCGKVVVAGFSDFHICGSEMLQ